MGSDWLLGSFARVYIFVSTVLMSTFCSTKTRQFSSLVGIHASFLALSVLFYMYQIMYRSTPVSHCEVLINYLINLDL